MFEVASYYIECMKEMVYLAAHYVRIGRAGGRSLVADPATLWPSSLSLSTILCCNKAAAILQCNPPVISQNIEVLLIIYTSSCRHRVVKRYRAFAPFELSSNAAPRWHARCHGSTINTMLVLLQSALGDTITTGKTINIQV